MEMLKKLLVITIAAFTLGNSQAAVDLANVEAKLAKAAKPPRSRSRLREIGNFLEQKMASAKAAVEEEDAEDRAYLDRLAPVAAEELRIHGPRLLAAARRAAGGSAIGSYAYKAKLAFQTLGVVGLSALSLKALQNFYLRSVLADPTMPENSDYSPAGAITLGLATGAVACTQLYYMLKARCCRA